MIDIRRVFTQVETIHHETDGRRRRVVLTPSGRETWHASVECGVRVQEALYSSLSARQRDQFGAALRTLLRATADLTPAAT